MFTLAENSVFREEVSDFRHGLLEDPPVLEDDHAGEQVDAEADDGQDPHVVRIVEGERDVPKEEEDGDQKLEKKRNSLVNVAFFRFYDTFMRAFITR